MMFIEQSKRAKAAAIRFNWFYGGLPNIQHELLQQINWTHRVNEDERVCFVLQLARFMATLTDASLNFSSAQTTTIMYHR
jgi:hypothetical protein